MISKLWIIDKDKASWQFIDSLGSYNGFTFFKNLNEIIIQKGSREYKLPIDKSIEIEHILFYYAKETHIVIYSIFDTCSIGRNEDNTVTLGDHHISNYHVRIENDTIYDLDSLNGLYLNGYKKKSSNLAIGDEFLIGYHRFIYLKRYLVYEGYEMERLIKSDLNIPVGFVQPTYFQKSYPLQKQYDIELPHMSMSVKKSSLLAAIGPSIMIASSSVVSSIGLSFLQKTTLVSTLTSFVSSMTMAISFVLYGLWNRHHQYKEALNENCRLENLYDVYLSNMNVNIQNDLNGFKNEIENYVEELITSFHSVENTLFLGYTKQDWCSFICREVAYDRLNEVRIQNRQELIDSYSNKIEQPYFVCSGHYWLKNDKWLYPILENYLWYSKDDKKIVFVGNFELNWIFFDKRFSKLLSDDCIIVTNQYDFMPNENLVLYIGQQEPLFRIDGIIDECNLSCLKLSNRRKLMKYEQIKCNDFYSNFLKENPIRNSKLNFLIPIGMDSNEKVKSLDFISIGSHGLIAGMTGSGKSEWLSYVIMMLAWSNSPTYFQYILIDFKGGAFGQTLYDLAHCAGMVTNLDHSNMQRFFHSIQFELEERQRRFSEKSVSDIYEYNQMSTMSHLWIIIDEFAQMKQKYPEMMTQLQEIARIGRSLGIHLILCTQKPSGVVNDQIWSNSSWQVCFNVNSKQDSREVIQSDLAYGLENPGDFILRTNLGVSKYHGFWLKEYTNLKEWREFDFNQTLINENMNSGELFLNVLKNKILNLNEERKWILLPRKIQEGAWGVIDVCDQQKQVQIEFNRYMMIFTRNQDVIFGLIDYFYDEVVVVYGTYAYKSYVDFSFLQPRYFSALKNCICIAFGDIDLDLIDKSIRIIQIVDNVKTVYHVNSMPLVCDICKKEEIQTFFNMYKIPDFTNQILYQNTIYEIFYHTKKEADLKRKDQMEISLNLHRNCIGFNEMTDQPVYVDSKRKLLILYVQKEMEVRIKDLVKYLDFFEVIKMEQGTILNPEDLYSCQILWMGYGFNEYAFMLKRNMFYTNADMIYFRNKEGMGVIE